MKDIKTLCVANRPNKKISWLCREGPDSLLSHQSTRYRSQMWFLKEAILIHNWSKVGLCLTCSSGCVAGQCVSSVAQEHCSGCAQTEKFYFTCAVSPNYPCMKSGLCVAWAVAPAWALGALAVHTASGMGLEQRVFPAPVLRLCVHSNNRVWWVFLSNQ